MCSLKWNSVIYWVIVLCMLLGIVGGFFLSFDFNPWTIAHLGTFASLLLLCLLSGFRFGACAALAGCSTVIAVVVGLLGSIFLAVVSGLCALAFAALGLNGFDKYI